MESIKIQIPSAQAAKTQTMPANAVSGSEWPADALYGFQALLQGLMAGDTGKPALADASLPAGVASDDLEAEACCAGEPALPVAAGIAVAAAPIAQETPADATPAPPPVATGNLRPLAVTAAADGKLGHATGSDAPFPGFQDRLHEHAENDARDKSAPAMTSHHGQGLAAPSATTSPSRALEAIADHRDPTVANVPVPQFTHGMAPSHPTHPTHAVDVQSAASVHIDTPIGTPEWPAEFTQKIVWLAGEKQQVAELHVNPPELGPLHIRLVTDEAQASAVFASSHSEVREAVEAALPRLREVLADSGITLGNASVTSDSPRDGSAFDRPRAVTHTFARDADGHTPAPELPPALIRNRGDGLVDLFA